MGSKISKSTINERAARPLIEGRDGRPLLRVPDYILLQQADKLIARLRKIIGENDSYIAELEHNLAEANKKIASLESNNAHLKEALSNMRSDIKNSDAYRSIKGRNEILKKSIETNKRTIAELVYRLNKLENG